MIDSRIAIILVVLFQLTCNCKFYEKKKQHNYRVENTPEIYLDSIDDQLIENSGMIFWNDLFWTINDSGGENNIYAFDTLTGAVVQTVEITNSQNIDWEDIAQDEDFIYIAETGNNSGIRTDLQILKVSKKSISDQKFQEVVAEKIFYSYANQVEFVSSFRGTSFDCEALFAFNSSLYIFTKDWVNFSTVAYEIPTKPGRYEISPIDSFMVNGLITGADILNDGTFALVGYQDFHSFIWTFKNEKGELFGNSTFIDLGMLQNAQTEGICFGEKEELFFSCERTESYPPMMWRIVPSKNSK